MSTKANKKLLSIITVNYNNADNLFKTLQSVYNQSNALKGQFEYIIIDGGSTDKSLSIIKEYNSKKPNLISYWCSEKDNGIYNAMNKGIKKAKGEYCLFLNAGDYLLSKNTLSDLFQEIKNKKADIFYSDLYSADNKLLSTFPEKVDIAFFMQGSFNHQNSLLKRSLFKTVNQYDETYKITADVKFFAECAYAKKKFMHIKTPIAAYDGNGVSASINHVDEVVRYNTELYPDLGPIFKEYQYYKDSIYGKIIRQFGHPKSLDFFLRVYRFFYRLFHKR